MGLRAQLEARPWLGWILAVVAIAAAVLMGLRSMRGSDASLSSNRMAETVTIRFTDTNETVTMTQGELARTLIMRGGTIDGTKGIPNPKTGQPTGFLENRQAWEQIVNDLNKELAENFNKPINAK
jgi:hypothetical protein